MIKLNKQCNIAVQITNLKSVKSLNPTLSVTLGSTTDEPVHPMPEFPITQINYNNKQAYLNMQQSEELVYFIKHCHTLVFHLTTETKEIPTNTAFGQITYVCTQAASIAFFYNRSYWISKRADLQTSYCMQATYCCLPASCGQYRKLRYHTSTCVFQSSFSIF